MIELGGLVSKLQGPTHLPLPRAGFWTQALVPSLYMGSGDVNSLPHAYVASTSDLAISTAPPSNFKIKNTMHLNILNQ